MRKSLAVLAVSLLIAAPAHATGGLLCRTGGSHLIEVGLVIGHAVAPSIVSARLRDGGAEVPVHIAQSWLDADELRLDLVDSNGANALGPKVTSLPKTLGQRAAPRHRFPKRH